MVVIMMGGSATGRPGRWLPRAFALLALGFEREIDHHDPFFLTMPISRMMPIKRRR
jgi:hypothetical protein